MLSGDRTSTARPTAFARSVLTLASGTAAAQALLALSLPVLTRLYTPADYGALAVFSSTITVLLVLASLRFELAIPLPESDEDAASLLALSFLVLAGIAGAVALVVWLAGDALVTAANVPVLRGWLWLMPVGFVGAGSYQALSYWAIRRRSFDQLARTRMVQGAGQVATQLGLGALGAGTSGLLFGDLVGRVAGGGGLALQALREWPRARVTRSSLGTVARRYRRFPLLTTWAGLLNIGSLQLPSIVFAAGFGAAAAGRYALSYKVLVLPTMLLAQAVGQVFLSRAAGLAREPEELRRLTDRTALALFACGLPVFGAIGLAGPPLFAAVMGPEWETSGRYAQVLAPWFAVWLVSNPLSGLLSVREWQGSALAFSSCEFLLRLGALLAGAREHSPLLAVALLSASGVVISVASIARFLRAGRSSVARLLGPAGRLLALAAGCLLPAAAALRFDRPLIALLVGLPAIGAYYLLVLRMLPVLRLSWAPAEAPTSTSS